jgi:hypothetical protein
MDYICGAKWHVRLQAEVPSSAWRKMDAICCSLNRIFFMQNPPSGQGR